MKSVRELLPGCFELQTHVATDARGTFVKPFEREVMAQFGWHGEIAEIYYSLSHEGVLRGMHLQVAPHGHDKIVAPTAGSVVDVLLDLRADSPTLGKHAVVKLSAEKGNCVLIANGVAHGFCVPSGAATLLYAVTSAYNAESDTGVRWDSAGIEWPIERPILSSRDAELPTMEEFLSLRSV
jgi:dTDP-4-dehydrorhamnose 3,5-epimerase